MTDFEADLLRIEGDLRGAGPDGPPGIFPARHGRAWLLYRRLQHASLTGDLAQLASLASAVDEAIAPGGCVADLYLLKAHIALKRHRFAEAEVALEGQASLGDLPLARLLHADLHLQHGRYAEARNAIDVVLAAEHSWDSLARAAFLASICGQIASADLLYEQAEDELNAKQMQTYAWLELQRGQMHLQRGDYGKAEAHYRRAEAAYSGYWLTAERLAELAGIQGRFGEAIGAYQQLLAASERPGWKHAIGDLYAISGDLEAGTRWKRMAYEDYAGALQRGEVYYLNHLVELCCEMPGCELEAIEYARSDVALRSNYITQADLAWALYRGGRTAEALEWMGKALTPGMVSARLYVQAACLYAVAGNTEISRTYIQLARRINPKPGLAYVRSARI